MSKSQKEHSTQEESGGGQLQRSRDVSSALEQLDLARTTLVEQIQDVVGRIDGLTPKSGVFNSVGRAIANRLDKASIFLEERTVGEMGSQFFQITKKYYVPLAFGAIGIGVGAVVNNRMQARKNKKKVESTGPSSKQHKKAA